MLARLRAVSAAAHGTDANLRRLRYEDTADCVIVYGYDLPGPGGPASPAVSCASATGWSASAVR